MISFDDFKKLDIRIGTIVSAERIPNADKLLKLNIDLGIKTRQIVAGIAEHYKPETLVGKQIPVLANLEPKTLRGLESQGMLLAASNGGTLALLHPDIALPPGSLVR